jgi:hypothetical protein
MLISTAVVATLSVPLTAQAQGTLRGAEEGEAAGGNATGPLGAIVGGAVGAATGTVGGILGVEERRVFANTSYGSGIRLIPTKATCARV